MFEKGRKKILDVEEERRKAKTKWYETINIELNDYQKYLREYLKKTGDFEAEDAENLLQQSTYIDSTYEIFLKDLENKVKLPLAELGLDLDNLGEWTRYMAVVT